jgi:hypothetical protein
MGFEITGLDKLQRQLEDAGKAFQALDGEIATLRFDPHDPGSVNAAIQQMEEAIDAKVEPYHGNPLVKSVADQLKEKYRAAIFKRIAEARIAGNNS